MRIMIKGGVWKNTEDEILKAAVMKYGKNQWARISSLLVRKSAKQCKARWYEWLDPSIKKTEWTREEDEKLLHLAKLMPTQWRTIAPIVGRTPVQCLERYEKLLDAACQKGDDGYEGNDDPRRLRPGEIDPNPESKPARPDPVDMDEDEKEMLSEARARLANTLGKKAKRKAREKQLEEARRLASLQKRRELKAAGIDMGGRKRKLRGIDYNAEIPFEHAPQSGFYDVSNEKERTAEVRNQPFKPTSLAELDGKRRKDMEDNLAKLDTRRQQVLARNDMPKHLDQVGALNDGEQVRKRSKLMLPTPQVSEGELAELARLGEDGGVDPALLAGAGGDATRGLLGSYGQTPNRTPMRTPMRTPSSGQDAILVEAANLAALQATQTPLAGGTGPDLQGSDFSGVTPRRKDAPTPNVLATPLRTPGGTGMGATPMRTPMVGPGATPMRTPMRDAMGINDPDSLGAPGSRQEERARMAGQREELRSGFASLPAPRNEYQISIPELPEQAEAMEAFEEDAADRDARRAEAEAAAIAREMAKRSHCLQRGLPRPVSLTLAPSGPEPAAAAKMVPLDRAAAMIATEMRALLEHDAAKFPIKVSKKDKVPRPAAAPIDQVEPEEMAAAAGLVAEEAKGVREAMGHEGVESEEYATTWESCMADIMYLPSAQRYGRAASATNADKLAAVQGDFAAAKAEVEKAAKRAAKLEQKVQVLTAGLAQRGASTCRQILEARALVEAAQTELSCFRALHHREELAGPARIQGLMEEVSEQSAREKDLQAKFQRLTRHKALLAEVLSA